MSRTAWRAWDWSLGGALAAGLVASIWAAALLLGRVGGLSAPPYDLAFFQQVIWNVGQDGRWISSFNEGSFLGVHFSPILIAPALTERLIWPDVRALSLLHAIAIGAFVPATFLFLRAGWRPSRLAGRSALIVAACLPMWGAMQEVVRSDFHPEVAGVVLALLAGWAGLTGRPRALWALAILALLTREDLSYAVLVIGLVIAARGPGQTRRHGVAVAGMATVWAAAVFGVLMPAIRAGASSDTAAYYAWLGGGWNVLFAPFTKTSQLVGSLTRGAAWLVVAGMVASLAGLPLLRPRWALAIVPPLLALMLSAHDLQATARLQYPVILVVPLLAASLFGGRRALAIGARWRRRGRRRVMDRRRVYGPPLHGSRRALLVVAVAIPAVAGAWLQGSLPPFNHRDPAFRPAVDAIDRLTLLARDVPTSSLLVADEGLVAPLAGRPRVIRLGAVPDLSVTSFVILDRSAWSPTGGVARLHDQVLARLSNSARPVLRDDGRFILFGPDPTGPSP